MGRLKYDKFTANQLLEETINVIRADITRDKNVSDDDYDWLGIDIRIKRANRAQRHRFADTIQKLETYLSTTSEKKLLYDVGYDTRTSRAINGHAVSFGEFARITGRNIKTVRDWAHKDFLCSCRNCGWIIFIEQTIEILKKIQAQRR